MNKDDLTRERVLGAIAAIDPAADQHRSGGSYLMEKTKEPHARAGGLRVAQTEAKRPQTYTVKSDDGIKWPHEIPVLPKWFEMQEGAWFRRCKRGFEIGPRGQSRNEHVQALHHPQRPAVRFDLCTKCQLCWFECPDECFDPTNDGFYDMNYEYCVGCGRCAQVCPVKECIVMVDELRFDDHKSPWEQYKKDKDSYIAWAEGKKGTRRVIYPFVTGTGMNVSEGSTVPEGKKTVVRKQEEVEV